MSHLKLIKLLYLLDRKTLYLWGYSVTFDNYISSKYGPVLSKVYSLIHEEDKPGEESYWKCYISSPKSYNVSLLKKCPYDDLSEAEIGLINEIYKEYGCMNKFDLINRLRKELIEWDTKSLFIPIEYGTILKYCGKSEKEIEIILNELDAISYIDKFTL